MSINDDILNLIVRRQVYLERYKAGLFKQSISPILNKTIQDIVARVQRMDESISRTRLEEVLRDIKAYNEAMSARIERTLTPQLQALMAGEVSFTAEQLTRLIPDFFAIKIGRPSATAMARMVTKEPFQGLVLNEWTQRIGQAATMRAKMQLRIGLAEGESVPKMAKRMSFIGEISKREAEMVVRTATNYVATSAKSSVYSENSDIIKAVQWRSTLDGRTSSICQSRDGETYGLDEDHPVPPAHPNCRSTIVPILKSYRELGYNVDDVPEGTRASMNGQVPASETYQSWLKKQPKEFVDEVLGPKRSSMFRSGEMTLDKFVDNTGRTLTLDELAKKI